MLDLNIIAAFLEAAKMGNLSEVAQKFHITPSAISQKIKSFENQVDKTLFIRRRFGVTLTREGKDLYEVCKNFQMGLAEVANWIEKQKGIVGGEVSVAAPHGLLSYEWPSFLKLFYEKYDQMFVSLKSLASSADVEEEVLAGRVCLGIIVGTCKKTSLKSRRLVENNPILMVCSPDYFLAGKKTLTKDDLIKARIIIHGGFRQRSFKDVCREAGIDFYRNRQKLCLPDMESCKRHVLEGLGVSFISRMYIRDELKNGRLVSLPGFEMNCPIYLISRTEKYESPATTVFKKELVNFCSALG